MVRWKRNQDNGSENQSQNQEQAQVRRGRWSKQQSKGSAEEKAYDLFAEMMIKKIENIKGDWKQPWFNSDISTPRALYGKHYNGMNALMLTFLSESKGYTVPVFATHDRIFSLNFGKDENGNRVPLIDKDGEKLPFVHVKKGETSFPVILSQTNIVHKDTKEKISYPDYVFLPREEQENYKFYHNYKVYPVFNVDQTNLKEARPEMYQKLLDEGASRILKSIKGENFSFEPLDQMVEGKHSWLCPITTNNGSGATYNPSKNVISVPEKSLFLDSEEYYGTLLHEMAHSTGHKDVFDRLKPAVLFGSPDYAREELVAEMSSALICQRYGIAKSPDAKVVENSALYLKSWLASLKEDPKYIKNVLGDVRAASSRISVTIDSVQEIINKESNKLDLRDDDNDDLQYDEDGNVIENDGNHYAADKKQGEDEGKEETQQKGLHHKR